MLKRKDKVVRQQVENPDDQIWIDSAITRVSESPIDGKGLFVTSPVKAGDIIYSGTPENVGPVVRGDTILCRIERLPDMSVRIV